MQALFEHIREMPFLAECKLLDKQKLTQAMILQMVLLQVLNRQHWLHNWSNEEGHLVDDGQAVQQLESLIDELFAKSQNRQQSIIHY